MGEFKWPPSATGGDVNGPGASTDNALVRWDGANGDSIQDSTAILTDGGALSGLTGLSSSGTITFSSLTAGRLSYLETGGALTASPITADSSGNLGSILTASLRNDSDLSSASDAMLYLENRNDTPDSHGHLQFKRGRAANANLVNGDTIGGINFHPRFGGSSNAAAQLEARYTGDGTTRLADFVFYTSNGGALAERARITAAGLFQVAGLTASTVIYSDASKNLTSSAVTPTELGYLSGVTSALQTQINAKAPSVSPTFTTPALGTPSSGVLTNCTGLPVSTGVSGLGTGVATFLATPSSANLASAVTDETGSGALVFGTSPTLTTPAFSGTPTGTVTSGTYTPTFTGVANFNTYANAAGTYIRVGNVVHVSLVADVTATTAALTATQFEVSLPITSNNFSSGSQAFGTGTQYNAGGTAMASAVVASKNGAQVINVFYNAAVNSSQTFVLTFSYRVV